MKYEDWLINKDSSVVQQLFYPIEQWNGYEKEA